MKTLTTLSLIVLGFLNCLFAQEVTSEMAATVARNFLYEKVCQYVEPIEYSEIGIAESMPWQEGNTTLLYIFNMKPSGFVIVSGNRAMTPVFGYNHTGLYRADNQPPNVSYWIGHYADQVKFAHDAQLTPSDAVNVSWEKYLADDFQSRDIGQMVTQVGPLLTSAWDQGWPYNINCPEDPFGPGGHALAGCVATAQVQLMYYWRWPDHGQGYCSYIPATHPEYGVQRADFE
ncbi:MAG: Spi family protease inhibitor, partial [Bacteroidia bacterium]|nr:Spi family protease inhibitor [Bacteroidia bacterium]